MKHKLIIALFIFLFGGIYSVQAQSVSVKKIQADLQQRKQHGTDLLTKAHQQQQQAKNETRPSNSPSFQQQPTSNSSKHPGQQQPLLNNPNKKEEINQ